MNRTVRLAIAALLTLLTTLALACGNDAPASSSARSAERTSSDSPAAQTPGPDATSEPASTSSLFALVPTQAAPDSPTETPTSQPTAAPSAAPSATPEPDAATPQPTATEPVAAPSATPEPTATPEPPPATATPAPTNTPAATPTSQPTATAAPANTPEPTATPPAPTNTPAPETATPVPEPTPTPQAPLYGGMTADEAAMALGKIDWDAYTGGSRGVEHWSKLARRKLDVRGSQDTFTCGPKIGSAVAPNAESNPTYTDASHFIWVWTLDADENGRCLRVDKYTHWLDEERLPPLPEPLTESEIEARAATQDTVITKLRGVYDDFTLPYRGDPHRDVSESGVNRAFSFMPRSEVFVDGVSFGSCSPRYFPLAFWSDEWGFEAVVDSDLVRLDSLEEPHFFDESRYGDLNKDLLERRRKARDAGAYFVLARPIDIPDLWRSHGLQAMFLPGQERFYTPAGAYCWVVDKDTAAELASRAENNRLAPCLACEDYWDKAR